jgi:single-strand DNA-binding protein
MSYQLPKHKQSPGPSNKSPVGEHTKTMKGLNKVTLIGNLGKDPDVQQLEGNLNVAKFSLATTESYKDDKGQLQSNTEWHTIVLWRGLADLAHKYLQKGSLVYIEGKLKTRQFDDKEGKTRYITEIIADQLIMLDKRNDAPADEGTSTQIG